MRHTHIPSSDRRQIWPLEPQTWCTSFCIRLCSSASCTRHRSRPVRQRQRQRQSSMIRKVENWCLHSSHSLQSSTLYKVQIYKDQLFTKFKSVTQFNSFTKFKSVTEFNSLQSSTLLQSSNLLHSSTLHKVQLFYTVQLCYTVQLFYKVQGDRNGQE